MNFPTMTLELSLFFLQVLMSRFFPSDLNCDLSQIECEVFSILVIVIINDFLLLNMTFILDKNIQSKYTLKFITIIVLESVEWFGV